ncbi:MAG: hypothetical protein FJY10_00380 [Bacteroidetes bacterium]|nr:hypothetical protein [Bacteroidota bacterium]
MKKLIYGFIGISLSVVLFMQCRKESDPPVPIKDLGISYPGMVLKHDLYYRIDCEASFIEVSFKDPIDTASIGGNISLSDQSGLLDTCVDITIHGRKVLISWHSGFQLKEGWRYFLTLKRGLGISSGLSLTEDQQVEIRTTSRLLQPLSGKQLFSKGLQKPLSDTIPNAIAVISDIHMGDSRAMSDKYCWFGKNGNALTDFLDYVANSGQFRSLVIIGDLFDEWIIPYSINPLDPQFGILTSEDYFKAIANAPVNKPIFDRLKSIASGSGVQLVYVPGNHDMLTSQAILNDIIPGAIWKGDATGLGRYIPVEDVVMEHGHRFDFFNCPQPLVNQGHILPPGYFISRLYAQGMMQHAQEATKQTISPGGSFEFLSGWTLALTYTMITFKMTPPPMDSAIVLMGGVDGYSNPLSYNGARNMYAAHIEDLWMQTQAANEVPVPDPSCLIAILNGMDLYHAATVDYLQGSPSTQPYKIAAFGHTHHALLEVYPEGKNYSGIYANSGTWIDADQCKYPVRTFLVIKPGEWTGSDLDVVSLYQYNLDSNSGEPGSGYLPVLLAEENVTR